MIKEQERQALKYQEYCVYVLLMKFREVLSQSKISPEEMDCYDALRDYVMASVIRVNQIIVEHEETLEECLADPINATAFREETAFLLGDD